MVLLNPEMLDAAGLLFEVDGLLLGLEADGGLLIRADVDDLFEHLVLAACPELILGLLVQLVHLLRLHVLLEDFSVRWGLLARMLEESDPLLELGDILGLKLVVGEDIFPN
jgi:hypothetical protein